MKLWRPRFGGMTTIPEAIEVVFRNTIIHGINEFTARGAEHKGFEWATMKAAILHAKMFNLVETGGFSYEQLGVRALPEGGLPSRVIEEHLAIKEIYQRVIEDKNRV